MIRAWYSTYSLELLFFGAKNIFVHKNEKIIHTRLIWHIKYIVRKHKKNYIYLFIIIRIEIIFAYEKKIVNYSNDIGLEPDTCPVEGWRITHTAANRIPIRPGMIIPRLVMETRDSNFRSRSVNTWRRLGAQPIKQTTSGTAESWLPVRTLNSRRWL